MFPCFLKLKPIPIQYMSHIMTNINIKNRRTTYIAVEDIDIKVEDIDLLKIEEPHI